MQKYILAESDDAYTAGSKGNRVVLKVIILLKIKC